MLSLLPSKSKDDDNGKNDKAASAALTSSTDAALKILPSYGSCPRLSTDKDTDTSTSSSYSPVKRLQRVSTPPPWLSELLMGSSTTTTTADDYFLASTSSTSPNNNDNDNDNDDESSPPPPTPVIAASSESNNNIVENNSDTDAAAPAVASDNKESTSLAVETIEQEQEEGSNQQRSQDTDTTSSSPIQRLTTMTSTIFSPLTNRLLSQKVATDKLHQYQLLTLLSTNAKYASLGFLAIYLLLVILLWTPLWILAQLITETGVYLFLSTSAIYGGRCLLRLLAFPGTNVRVYGEIENEFAKYSCKMLEGGAGALEDFAKSVRAGYANAKTSENSLAASKARKGLGLDENEGWDLVDVPATYKRVSVYKNRILGVYSEVLHCLLEENGQGYCDYSSASVGDSANSNGASADRNGFYRLGDNMSGCKDTCKRNLCCERKNSNGSSRSSNGGDVASEGIQLDVHRSPTNSGNSSPSNSNSLRTTTTTTGYGNNPLVGDIGSMGNLTPKARSDGRELYTLLTSLLQDLSALESSSSNVLRLVDDKNKSQLLKNTAVSKETVEHATKLIQRAAELREFTSRIKLPSDNNDENETENKQQHDEEDVGAEAVRHRLEEQGTGSSSSSTMSMVWSAVQAFGSMIDPPPHESIFGLDVIRGTFLARYDGAKQFWVQRSSRGNDGRLDVIVIPSSTTTTCSNEEGTQPDQSLESFLPLSPRKGRDGGVVTPLSSSVGEGMRNVGKKRKAVLYCNPNAGLVEVATGMGLTGGNVGEGEDDEDKEPTCWTEYYIEHGYDVYLFNYAGYGRSYGGNSWNDTSSSEFSHGVLAVLKRVFFSTFMAFKPTSESLKSDAAAVAKHLVDVAGVEELIIHGESIGGMAAAGAARAITATTQPTSKTPTNCVLICDRTFTNLEAVAQRLVGQWTGNAIRLLTPTWSTDVARDFLGSQCPKIVAQDCADEIIHDYSSLKSGVSIASELTKGQTKNVGWKLPGPVEYRMADLDNVSIANSRLAYKSCGVKNPPTWPADKRVSWSEAYHFAACVKRIGKLATVAKKRMQEAKELENSGLSQMEEPEEGIEVSYPSSEESTQLTTLPKNTKSNSSSTKKKSAERNNKALIKLWNSLACMDGLCGHPLGHAVKEGYDCTIAWLCCVVVYGGQVLAEKAEQRWDKQNATPDGGVGDDTHRAFLEVDFDLRPEGYQWDEDELAKHPVPIPEVLSSLKENAQKHDLQEVEAELNYVIGTLEYMVSRLTSKENTVLSLKRRNGGQYYADEEQQHWVDISTGCFLNLNCGHNNQFSSVEREKLIALIRKSCGGDSSV